MLVLVATLQSHLGYLLDRHDVIRLLDRTIKFLSSLQPISGTLAMDALILTAIRQQYFSEELGTVYFSPS